DGRISSGPGRDEQLIASGRKKERGKHATQNQGRRTAVGIHLPQIQIRSVRPFEKDLAPIWSPGRLLIVCTAAIAEIHHRSTAGGHRIKLPISASIHSLKNNVEVIRTPRWILIIKAPS